MRYFPGFHNGSRFAPISPALFQTTWWLRGRFTPPGRAELAEPLAKVLRQEVRPLAPGSRRCRALCGLSSRLHRGIINQVLWREGILIP